jgi:uncharacterized protein
VSPRRRWFFQPVPRDHHESDAAFHHRRWVVAGVSLAGAGLLGVSLSTEPDSPEFYALTLGVAGTWVAGGVLSGPLHLGRTVHGQNLRRPVVAPVLTGMAAFSAFYAAALVAREIPVLDRALRSVLRYAKDGSGPLVALTTLANGAAEEVFFRGALYAAVGAKDPVVRSTAGYLLATTPTRNPALILASLPMGALFALQRRASGGIQAPIITHLTWSALMLRYLPPLFRDAPASGASVALGKPERRRSGWLRKLNGSVASSRRCQASGVEEGLVRWRVRVR